MSDETSNDRDANLASLVHHTVSTSNEYVADFDKMLASTSEKFLLPREVIQSIRALLWANGALVSNLFEENQQMFDMVKETISKVSQ